MAAVRAVPCDHSARNPVCRPAALDHAFTTLGQERVISLIAPANAPSIRVAERLGETLQGETQMSGRTFLIYAIDRQEALSRRNG